jgi:hypothetical protein
VCDGSGKCISELAPAIEVGIERFWEARYRKTVHNHDGIYVRFGLNFGYAVDSIENGSFQTSSTGLGFGPDIAYGLTLSDHIVVGPAFHALIVPGPSTVENDVDITVDHNASYYVLGILLDVYPDPRSGLHFTATVGVGHAEVNVDQDNDDDTNGIGFRIGGGYDFWVGEQWSLGALASVAYVGGANDDFGSHRAVIPMVSVSALLH